MTNKKSKLVYLSSGEEFGTHGGCMAFIGIDWKIETALRELASSNEVATHILTDCKA